MVYQWCKNSLQHSQYPWEINSNNNFKTSSKERFNQKLPINKIKLLLINGNNIQKHTIVFVEKIASILMELLLLGSENNYATVVEENVTSNVFGTNKKIKIYLNALFVS